MAESQFRVGNIQEAALKFNDFVDSKPASHLAEAKMRLGDCFRHLGDNATAKVYYDEVTKQFPGSPEATKAGERLGELAATAK